MRNDECPVCGGDLEDIISYHRGNKTADGERCTECDYEEYWEIE